MSICFWDLLHYDNPQREAVNKKLKTIVAKFYLIILEYLSISKILPHNLAPGMLPGLSNKLILYSSHSESPRRPKSDRIGYCKMSKSFLTHFYFVKHYIT